MARVKTLITRTEVDIAQRAHKCQANSRHRIERGDKRLKVRNGRNWDHYCLECANTIAKRDIAKLETLACELDPAPSPY